MKEFKFVEAIFKKVALGHTGQAPDMVSTRHSLNYVEYITNKFSNFSVFCFQSKIDIERFLSISRGGRLSFV